MKIPRTLFLLFLVVSHVHAEDINTLKDLKEYDVEIIIFEDANARYLMSETWNQNIKTTEQQLVATEINEITENLDKLSVDELSIDEINATGFKSIKPAILNTQYKRINTSSGYNVLFYGAWRQAGLEENKAFEININELENRHAVKSENTLAGTFKLVLARYLHIYNQLNYQRKITETLELESEVTSTDSAESKEQTEELSDNITPHNGLYSLTSHRRMRSKELHYIDHPLVGMLIQINPAEKTEEMEEIKEL